MACYLKTAAMLVQMANNRTREYEADRGAQKSVEIWTGWPTLWSSLKPDPDKSTTMRPKPPNQVAKLPKTVGNPGYSPATYPASLQVPWSR